MKFLKKLFTPLTPIDNKTSTMLIFINCLIAILLWQLLAGGGLIPTPLKVFDAGIKILESGSFYENLTSSLTLTMKGMGYSIIIALFICYLSTIPFFKPITGFIIKCRYLTLTGLIFLFTLLTRDGHTLKLSLLMFGIIPFFSKSFNDIIESINTQEYELCATLRMNKWKTLLEVIIIGRLDQIFVVLAQNFAIAWMMITMVEGLCYDDGGLGVMIIKFNKYLDLSSVFSLLFIILSIGIYSDFIIRNLRAWLFPYLQLNAFPLLSWIKKQIIFNTKN